jgi:hypothetical protein
MGVLVAAGALLAPVAGAAPGPVALCEYWVGPTGSDGQAGTAASPWLTLEHAAEHVPDAGCTVWFEQGLYPGPQQITRRFQTITTFRAASPYQSVFEHSGTVIDVDGARNLVLDGFEIRHAGTSSSGYVVIIDQGNGQWAENIVIRNSIIHDSFQNDLLKIHNGVRNAVVEGNLFFNQGTSEQHMDVNSVTDIVIQDNIFFNDFAASGRPVGDNAKHFIIVKDSNGTDDGQIGAERITIRRNVFLNWQGGRETMVKLGNDGKPYFEANTIEVVNNLLIGNSADQVDASFGVAGARQVTFANNTVVGDLPSGSFGFEAEVKTSNPVNKDITLANNIWSDPTGTMDEFSNGSPQEVEGLSLTRNLYWNGGSPVPQGDLVSPLSDDPSPVVADPHLETDHGAIVLPHWLGTRFASGGASIRGEFIRLVEGYARIGNASGAIDRADPAFGPRDDILGRYRGPTPDLGAYELDPVAGTGLCPSTGTNFFDIAPGRYYSAAVRWMLCEGITTGTSPITFSPEDPVTRAQIATFLWRAEDRPSATPITPFSDVSPGAYYAEAVAWMVKTGITTGTSTTTFSPDDPATRAQIAAFLWRQAGQPLV